MLRLLRLPFSRSLRVENSRNPALMGGAMLISPMLSFFTGIVPRSLPLRVGAITARAELSEKRMPAIFR